MTTGNLLGDVAAIGARYRDALRAEPKLRAYLGASVVDDIGVAVSAWAGTILTTNLFTDQRQRAMLMMPALVCFMLGNIVAGPLADWVSAANPARLARWRWRVVVWARVVETVGLGFLVLAVVGHRPTIARILPYTMLSAFMKTALRPTRTAFQVDLLRTESPQVDDAGNPLFDEHGAPRMYKLHLLSGEASSSLLRSSAVVAGLLLGGRIMAAVHGEYWPLLAFDVLTNLGFIGAVIFFCHPDRAARSVRFADLTADPEGRAPLEEAPKRMPRLRHFGISIRDGFAFLFRRDQRPLLALLSGTWLLELVNESYDGRMIVRHVLHGTPEAVREAVLIWQLVTVAALALLPVLARRMGSLGKIFLVTMLIDGFAISLGGRIAGVGLATAVLPFVCVLGADRALTEVSSTLANLAFNSASSSAIRGRIIASYSFAVLLGDFFVEGIATGVAEKIGIPTMLVRVGFLQVGFVAMLVVLGGRSLWNFGLRTATADT